MMGDRAVGRSGGKRRHAPAGAYRPTAPPPYRLLLLATVVLGAACGRAGQDRIAEVQQAADSADQLMVGVRMYLTNQGVRQAYVEADSAFVYEVSSRTELKGVKVTFYNSAGAQASVLTSREGTYRTRTGAMEARQNVVVVTSDGGRLATSLLRYDQAKNEVSTDQPYTYVSTDRNVQGDGFVSDPSFSNITTQRVRGRAGRFTLPGQ